MKKTDLLRNNWIVCVIAIFCCLLWGSAFPCIKLGYKMFDISSGEAGSQILFAGVRFAIAGIMVIIFGSISGKQFLLPQKSSVHKIVVLSMLQTVIHYILFYIGLAHTSGVNGSIINSSNIFLAILVATLIFHQEKLTSKKILGCLLGFAGVVIINLAGGKLSSNVSFLGDGFVFLSAISYAFSSCCIKIFSKDENPVLLSGYQFTLGGIIMIVTGLLMGGNLSPSGTSAYVLLLYMAFISAAAYTLWSVLLKYNPVSKVSVFGFANPVFGVLLSALILGETSTAFDIKSLIALLLISTGIVIVNLKEKA